MTAILASCVALGFGLTSCDCAAAACASANHAQYTVAATSADDATDTTHWRGAFETALGWLLPSSRRLCIRTAGRRWRDTKLHLAASIRTLRQDRGRLPIEAPKWLLPLAVSLVMLLAAPAGNAMAAGGTLMHLEQPSVTATAAEAAPEDAGVIQPTTLHGVSRTTRRAQASPSAEGNDFPRRPYWGMPNVVVTDPAEYPRPVCLENNNPDSFWYSMRPNIFNVPVEAEWDFYSIINTDRPDFTDAVYSVGKGVTYLETGFTFTKINTFDQHISTRQLPESLLRHGLTDEFELRLKWPGYLMSTLRDPHTGAQLNTFGSEDIDAGFKWEILQQQGWRPMTTLVAGMTLPTGTPGTSANFVQPHFNLLAGWGLRRWAYLKWQTGCDFVHSSSTQFVTPLTGASNPGFVTVRSPPNSWHESLSLLTQWTKRVGAFHEWFMISGTGGGDTRAQHFLDMGLYLYATPNVQFDVRVGRQISNRVNDFFTGAGFSGRW